MVHVGLVDLPQVVLLHDLDEYGKRLLLRYALDEQEAADEGAALAVAHFGVVDRVGLHHVEQALLAALVAKELVVRIGAVNVAPDDLLARRLLLDVVLELLLGVGEIGAAQVLPGERAQVEWNALSNVLFELAGLLFGPRVPVGDDLVPQLPADLLHLGDWRARARKHQNWLKPLRSSKKSSPLHNLLPSSVSELTSQLVNEARRDRECD